MRRLSAVIATLAFALALAPLAAQAAPAARSVAASAPVAVPALEVQLWPGGEAGQSVVIVSATLPDSTRLPATVRIPVPTGAQVVWAGEILGGDPGADPSRPYQAVQGAGGQYVQFEMSQARQAQVEFGGLQLTIDGSRSTARLDWVQSSEASETGFSVRFPAGATKVTTDPQYTGSPQTNSNGESLFTLPTKILKPGQKAAVNVGYETKAASAAGGSTLDAKSLLLLLGGVLVLAVAALVYVMSRQRAARE